MKKYFKFIDVMVFPAFVLLFLSDFFPFTFPFSTYFFTLTAFIVTFSVTQILFTPFPFHFCIRSTPIIYRYTFLKLTSFVIDALLLLLLLYILRFFLEILTDQIKITTKRSLLFVLMINTYWMKVLKIFSYR